MKFHKFADLFPEMDDEEFETLVDSMKENGFYESNPIGVWNGKIVDGKHRYKASRQANVEPVYHTIPDDWGEQRVLNWVIAQNLQRRHLKVEQKAALALEIYKGIERKSGQRTDLTSVDQSTEVDYERPRKIAADQVGINEVLVQYANSISIKRPDLWERVQAGQLPITMVGRAIAAPEHLVDDVIDRYENGGLNTNQIIALTAALNKTDSVDYREEMMSMAISSGDTSDSILRDAKNLVSKKAGKRQHGVGADKRRTPLPEVKETDLPWQETQVGENAYLLIDQGKDAATELMDLLARAGVPALEKSLLRKQIDQVIREWDRLDMRLKERKQ